MTHEIKFGKKKTFEGTYSQAFTLVSLLVDFLDFVPDGQQRTRQNVEGAPSHPHTATKACLARLTQPIPVIRILFFNFDQRHCPSYLNVWKQTD